MKLKLGARKSARAATQTPPLRTPNIAHAPGAFVERPTRVWSLLLPPSGPRR